MRRTFALAVLLVIASASARAQESVSVHLALGNPSGATTGTRDRDNFLMVKPQFVLSYDDEKGGANWVSWHLEKSDIGKVNRGDFHPDADLPADFKHIKRADYTHSGFDRGHLCNSKDRTKNKTNNDATFNMTNMMPQAPDNNQGPWEQLESYCRTLVSSGNELYIIAGGTGSGGTGSNGGVTTTIANGHVTVPSQTWKVIIVLPAGDDDLGRIDKNTRAIAVCMPNRQGIKKKDWREFVTTIRNVEAATGYDFLSELPKRIQNAIETRVDAEGTTPAGVDPCR